MRQDRWFLGTNYYSLISVAIPGQIITFFPELALNLRRGENDTHSIRPCSCEGAFLVALILYFQLSSWSRLGLIFVRRIGRWMRSLDPKPLAVGQRRHWEFLKHVARLLAGMDSYAAEGQHRVGFFKVMKWRQLVALISCNEPRDFTMLCFCFLCYMVLLCFIGQIKWERGET